MRGSVGGKGWVGRVGSVGQMQGRAGPGSAAQAAARGSSVRRCMRRRAGRSAGCEVAATACGHAGRPPGRRPPSSLAALARATRRGEGGAECVEQRAQSAEQRGRRHRQQPDQQLLSHGRGGGHGLHGMHRQSEAGAFTTDCAAAGIAHGGAAACCLTSLFCPCELSLKASRPCTSATPAHISGQAAAASV